MTQVTNTVRFVLDGRIVELENELNVTGKQLASAKGDAAAYVVQSSRGGSDNNLSSNQMTGLGVVFMGVVLLPLLEGQWR